jgi:hypothetical protein
LYLPRRTLTWSISAFVSCTGGATLVVLLPPGEPARATDVMEARTRVENTKDFIGVRATVGAMTRALDLDRRIDRVFEQRRERERKVDRTRSWDPASADRRKARELIGELLLRKLPPITAPRRPC